MNPTPPVNGAVRMRPGRRQSLRQVLALQEIAHEAALGLREDFRETQDREERARVAMAISSLGKSWTTLQDSGHGVVLSTEHGGSVGTPTSWKGNFEFFASGVLQPCCQVVDSLGFEAMRAFSFAGEGERPMPDFGSTVGPTPAN